MENTPYQLEETIELLQERIASLELSLEDQDYQRLSAESSQEFSRQGLQRMMELSRLMYLKNPLINRGVQVQSYYVFGQGVSVHADNDDVNDVVQAFLNDQRNRAAFTGQQALEDREREQQVTGNTFIALFSSRGGRVQVRTIPPEEIQEIVYNPDDAAEPWYYLRVWTEYRSQSTVTRTAYYRDWYYTSKDKTWGQYPIIDGVGVFHVKTGGSGRMTFGVPETYAALDWARAYKGFLEDWATITKAYSKFAFQLTVPGGKNSVASAKNKLSTTLSTSQRETNPPPPAGATFVASENVSLTPVKTAGATVSAEDGRRLLLMVCASLGLPESFFGDVSVGTLATAKSLDRPTELKFEARRSMWADVITQICEYVIVQAAGIGGKLAGVVTLEDDEDNTPIITVDGEPLEIRVSFPPILEHDVQASIDAIVKAATLGGNGTAAGTIPAKDVSRMLLNALGEDADPILSEMYPDDEVMTESRARLETSIHQFQEAIKHAAVS